MTDSSSHRNRLRFVAIQAMRDRGLSADFPADVRTEVTQMAGPPATTGEATRDLRDLPWCSIDNDESRDLDQLSVAEQLSDGAIRVIVAIADVDAAVPVGSACDRHAAINTTSVYTPAIIFPMLPERLSTDLTSLVAGQDRFAIAIDMAVAASGEVQSSDVYGARVRNQAKLAYRGIADWFDGRAELPAGAAGFEEQLQLQRRAAEALNVLRRTRGALDFASTDTHAAFTGERLSAIEDEPANSAKRLIENLMIAANSVTATFLDGKGLPSIRRVVKTPARWNRIRDLAASVGDHLPETADPLALAAFLDRRRAAQPDTFVDLSASVVSLLGSGEYAVDPPGAEPPGHFGLAVRHYGHSTAPNRRYPDLVTQRLIKAALTASPSPYAIPTLDTLAAHCTRQEDNAKKVERQVRKAAVALLIQSRVGERFQGIVTGASDKGTYVRVPSPAMEGRIVHGGEGLDVGDNVRVRLDAVNVDRGFIDFSCAS